VTIFGEFSPNGRLFTLGGFTEITEIAHIFVVLFFLGVDYVLILPKRGWDAF
jgi:hypothetical protein